MSYDLSSTSISKFQLMVLDWNTTVIGSRLVLLVVVAHYTSYPTIHSFFCFLLTLCAIASVGMVLTQRIIGYFLAYSLECRLVCFVLIGTALMGADGLDFRRLYKLAHGACFTSVFWITALFFAYFCSSVFYIVRFFFACWMCGLSTGLRVLEAPAVLLGCRLCFSSWMYIYVITQGVWLRSAFRKCLSVEKVVMSMMCSIVLAVIHE